MTYVNHQAEDRYRELVASIEAEVAGRDLHSIRLSFADQHGLLRTKTFDASLTNQLFRSGVGITGSLLTHDTAGNSSFNIWQEEGGPTLRGLAGAADMVMIPDPSTFRVLPWLEGTGWVQCDLYDLNGTPIELSTRRICTLAHSKLVDQGFELKAGLEIEFHLYRMDDSPPHPSSASHPGWSLLSERHADLIEPLMEPIRSTLTAIGLPPRSIEAELGPGQVELTFAPALGTTMADNAVLARSAIKQACARHGLHATFMCRPAMEDSFPSGWHMHQSLVDAEIGTNLFTPPGEGSDLSPFGLHYLAGLLAHAAESCLLTTPTVTGYKRYRPNSVAPDRISWSRQNRGAMLRLIGGPRDPATRIENRAGDPAANPYLYLTSQILSGLDGLDAAAEPIASSTRPYESNSGPRLPRTLGDAIDLFDGSNFYRQQLGDETVDYLTAIKRREWNRFLSTTTDWEQSEYFELF